MVNTQPEELFYNDPMYGCSNSLYWGDQNISPYCFRPVNNGVWFNLMDGGLSLLRKGCMMISITVKEMSTYLRLGMRRVI